MFRLLSFLCVIVFWSTTKGYKIMKNSNEANTIIAAHKAARNDIRNCKSYAKTGLMPKASDMAYMSYSNDMAKSAEEWGNEACSRGYKSCTHHKSKTWQNSMGIPVGENLGCSSNINTYLNSFMKQMIDDERAKYGWTGSDRGTCNGQKNNNCGHYTQIIWSDSSKVGCAVNTCSNMMICHYSNPGNVGSSSTTYPPYKATTGCGSSSNSGSNSNSNSGNSGSGKCCECANNPSKDNCAQTCENAVKELDSWCYSNNWDGTCKKHAQNLAKDCSDSGSGNSGSNAGSNSGTCCECKDSPSKSKCSTACENHVHGKDGWCISNAWDGTCKNYATKACSGAFTWVGDCGSDESDEAICIGSTLWSDDYNATHRFAVDKDQCSNDLPVYNYTTYNEEHRSDILYTLRFDAYSSDNDGNYTDQWVLTVSDMKLFENDTVTEIVAAVCDQEELKQCTKHEWDIKYQDAAKYLRDYLMPQALEVRDVDCSTIMAVNDANRLNGTSVALFVIGVIIVLLVIAVLLYFCVYRAKHKHRKNEKELKAIRDDDGCDEAVNDMEQTIVVETEVQYDENASIMN